MSGQQEQRNRAVGATLINRYYRLLMTNPEQLIGMYLAKAQFSHEHKGTAQTGLDNIRRSLHHHYGKMQNGRVTVSSMELNNSTDNRSKNQNQFVVVVSGTMFTPGQGSGRQFKHLIEVQEHQQANSGVFGIWADTLRFTNANSAAPITQPSPQGPKGSKGTFDWSKDTPPMFAQVTPQEDVPPPLHMTPAATQQTPISPPMQPQTATAVDQPPLSASEITGKTEADDDEVSSKKKSAKKAEKAPAAEAKKEEKPAAPKAAPSSFAELLRQRGGPSSDAKKTTTTVVATAPKTEDDKKKDEKKKEEKKDEKKEGAKSSGDAKKEGDSKRREGKRDDKKNGAVVFYDAFINNLAPGTVEKDIRGKLDSSVNITEVNVQSKPSKSDASITRTYAFLKFDKSEKDIPAQIAKIKAAKYVIKGKTMNIDAVHEKFEKEDGKVGSRPKKSSSSSENKSSEKK